jgi:endo-1,4-beta-mannosidase
MPPFLLGVNYWPRNSAMYAWQRFDIGEIREDMTRIKGLGLDVVRFFLQWEAFQPHPDTMNDEALGRFVEVMNVIFDAGLRAMPTLFCGHMSGVNWLPAWSLDRSTPHGRFRTISEGKASPYGIGDFYADPHLLRAQTLFAHRTAERVRDHPALYVWDLGNEFSNLREPATPADAAAWSVRLTETLIEHSGVGATGGMHGEDLERDRHIRPSSISQAWSFATMHGYPVYSAFARDRMDPNVVSFLMQVTQSCSGKRVLFSELGNPQCPPGQDRAGAVACLNEQEMADYAYAAIDRLHRRGALGAFWWCWADYMPWLAGVPPCDEAPHELRFGIVRDDGSFKPVAMMLNQLARERRTVVEAPAPIVDEAEYYASLPRGIFDRYQEYCALNR